MCFVGDQFPPVIAVLQIALYMYIAFLALRGLHMIWSALHQFARSHTHAQRSKYCRHKEPMTSRYQWLIWYLHHYDEQEANMKCNWPRFFRALFVTPGLPFL